MKGSQVRIFIFVYISVPKKVILFANSVDLDEMPHSVAFHQGLHHLPRYVYQITVYSIQRVIQVVFIFLIFIRKNSNRLVWKP